MDAIDDLVETTLLLVTLVRLVEDLRRPGLSIGGSEESKDEEGGLRRYKYPSIVLLRGGNGEESGGEVGAQKT